MGFRHLFDTLKPQRSRTPGRQARRRSPCRQPAPCRLSVETLEDRYVPAAVLALGDVALLEGNDGTQHAEVTVTLSEPHGNNVTVSYRTGAGTATAGTDFDAVSGKLT
jgi:Calx-beta domain